MENEYALGSTKIQLAPHRREKIRALGQICYGVFEYAAPEDCVWRLDNYQQAFRFMIEQKAKSISIA